MKRMPIVSLFATLVLLSSHPAEAQKPAKVRKIGFLAAGHTEVAAGHTEIDAQGKIVTIGLPPASYAVFRRSLRELGYAVGHNIVIEYRTAEDRRRLLELANELVQEKVEVIVANGGPAARSAKEATKTIPIAFTTSGDPVESGYVESLARPGGNMTGMSWLSFELVGKRLELLKEAVPRVSRVAILSNPQHPGEQRELQETQSTARALGMTLDYYQTRTSAEFDAAYDAITKRNVNGLLVFPEGVTLANRLGIVDFAAKHRLPRMLGWKEYVEAGGLMSYGPNRDESFRRIAVYVDKILKGTKPADLPVELPTKFELVVNLKTAKDIGVTITPNVLARADKVIKGVDVGRRAITR
jgi:putative ABC transport system substrate-binding protein